MENCVFEVDIPLNFTLCFMNLVILNEYHLILRTMNEIKETWEVMMQYRGVSSPPIKPILFFFWCFISYSSKVTVRPFLQKAAKCSNCQLGSAALLSDPALALSHQWVTAARCACWLCRCREGVAALSQRCCFSPKASLAFPGQDRRVLSVLHRRNSAEMRECSINKIPAAPDALCWGNRSRM